MELAPCNRKGAEKARNVMKKEIVCQKITKITLMSLKITKDFLILKNKDFYYRIYQWHLLLKISVVLGLVMLEAQLWP